MKRFVLLSCLLVLLLLPVFSQSVTRIAVIDMQKIYMENARDSAKVREFEEEKKHVQEEIAKLNAEVKAMQKERLSIISKNDATKLKEFDAKLYNKAQYLSEYIKTQQAALDEKAEKLSKDDDFAKRLYRAVDRTAQKEGYSVVIKSSSASGVESNLVWYSPMIDISDLVIKELKGE